MQEKIHGSCFYHVMVQGINKENIFKNDFYMKKYKDLIIEKRDENSVIILAYCIMNNHAHILIYCEKSEELGKYMKRLNMTYSYFYNKIQNRVGFVFRNRYQSQSIFSRQQLFNCLAYIHNNPVKAGLVSNPKEYIYSTYNDFLLKQGVIDDKSIKLIFQSSQNFEKTFLYIHKQNLDEFDEDFIDVKDKDIDLLIKEYQEKYHIEIKSIRKNKEILSSFLNQARKQTEISIIGLAKILGISKNTVSKYKN